MAFRKFFAQLVRPQLLQPIAVARTLPKASLSTSIVEDNLVVLKEDNGNSMKFPGIWLRDNCQCPECFHDNTKSRKVNWERTNVNVRAEHVNIGKENTITIDWNDKHTSTFDLNWLKERDFSPENRKRYINEIYKPSPQLWSKKDFDKVWNTFDFQDVINDDNVLLAWLQALAVQGFGIIKNSPHDVTVARQLSDRIGFIRRTTYGEEFEVKSKVDARNYAYLMTPLPLHTDMPYFEYKAGINILHCLVQSNSSGGANLMTDGFNVADRLRREFPKDYEVLSTVPVDWYDIGKDSGLTFHNIWRSPVICFDCDGQFHRINHNITKRDSHFTVPLEHVVPWYEAYDRFLQLAYAEAVEFKTTPGDVFVFNNLRMLHGRTAYEDSPQNKRHLIGAYVDWDIIYSKMRILKSQNKLK